MFETSGVVHNGSQGIPKKVEKGTNLAHGLAHAVGVDWATFRILADKYRNAVHNGSWYYRCGSQESPYRELDALEEFVRQAILKDREAR